MIKKIFFGLLLMMVAVGCQAHEEEFTKTREMMVRAQIEARGIKDER
ncbi:unnamed protein product, partial [marine sediment metagenome]